MGYQLVHNFITNIIIDCIHLGTKIKLNANIIKRTNSHQVSLVKHTHFYGHYSHTSIIIVLSLWYNYYNYESHNMIQVITITCDYNCVWTNIYICALKGAY